MATAETLPPTIPRLDLKNYSRFGNPLRQPAGDDGGAPLVAIGEEVEEKLRLDFVERDEAELVQDQERHAAIAAVQPRELAIVASFDEFADKICDARVRTVLDDKGIRDRPWTLDRQKDHRSA